VLDLPGEREVVVSGSKFEFTKKEQLPAKEASGIPKIGP
jgi:hypothetical protein